MDLQLRYYMKFVAVFLNLSGWYLKLCYNSFLPYCYHSVSHYSAGHLALSDLINIPKTKINMHCV